VTAAAPTLRCERYRCTLSSAACLARQQARRRGATGGYTGAAYPLCVGCAQGAAALASGPAVAPALVCERCGAPTTLPRVRVAELLCPACRAPAAETSPRRRP
jgi:hypothetical protein